MPLLPNTAAMAKEVLFIQFYWLLHCEMYSIAPWFAFLNEH